MVSKFNNTVYVLHDYNLNIFLYNLSKTYIRKIKKETNRSIKFISIKDLNNYNQNKIDIFWGNRPQIEILERLKNLKWVHLGSVGFDENLINYLKIKKIFISNSYDISNNEISQNILSYILYIHRGIYFSDILIEKNNLLRSKLDKYFQKLKPLDQNKILIVGYGRIGKKLASYLKMFCSNLYAIRNISKINDKNIKEVIFVKNIKSRIKNMDIVINLLPQNKNTENFFNSNLLKNFKKNSIFICAGRGDTYDLNTLVKLINKNLILGAYLDTFPKFLYKSPNEPIDKNSKILKNKKIKITPHISGYSQNYWDKQILIFTENLNTLLNKNKIKINEL